jgi:predicted outer membrane protein
MEGNVRKPNTGTFAALLAISAAAACSTMNRTYMSAGDVDLSTAMAAELSADETTMLRQMSDANIIGHLITVDSLEITMSDTALYHIKSDAVNSYAKMMHLAHSDDWKAMKDLAGAAGLIPTVDVTKLKSSHIAAGIDSVRKTSTMTKDQLYIRSQIELHRHALAELQVLEGVARNTALREHLTHMIPVVRDHLARAQALAGPLGIDKSR